MEDFIVTNFENIFKGSLLLYRDPEGNVGRQYPTGIGPIDILATQPATNCFVVIELKKGRGSDIVVGQTLRYMGWIEENLCEEGQGVRGLVICREEDARLAYALRMVRNIELYLYKVHFDLIPTQVYPPV